MRFPARLTLAATCCTLVFTSACSDSTSPNNSQDAAHVAAHFDSLYVSAAALASGSDNYTERALLLSLLEAQAAYGATPKSVTVTTANGTEHWNAFEIEDVEPDTGTVLDTAFLVVAYREAAAHTIVLAQYDASGLINGGEVLTNDSLPVAPSDGTGSTTRASLGGTCATPSTSLVNHQIASLANLGCTPATFNTSMTLAVPSTPNVDPALTSLSFPTTTLNGELFESNQAGTAIVRRVRALVRKHRSSNRL